eukprot:TRINITY_DN3242_c0_g2_i1.p2 TRINITY_DN3242_c0_g2~~TRINITY_DN3242_c0_g2_i1.p2  ORF type:complete len:196 (+),score=40.71 TRINITY_DN3242_c0_g2_i1:144-731(+)
MSKAAVVVAALLILSIILGIVAVAAPGWGKYETTFFGVTFTNTIGTQVIRSCNSSDGRCTTTSLSSDKDNKTGYKYYQAGQAALGLLIISLILWFLSLALVLFTLLAGTVHQIAGRAAVGKVLPFKFLVLIVVVLATVFVALSWIVWIGVAKPKDEDIDPCEFFLSIILGSLCFSLKSIFVAIFFDFFSSFWISF